MWSIFVETFLYLVETVKKKYVILEAGKRKKQLKKDRQAHNDS